MLYTVFMVLFLFYPVCSGVEPLVLQGGPLSPHIIFAVSAKTTDKHSDWLIENNRKK